MVEGFIEEVTQLLAGKGNRGDVLRLVNKSPFHCAFYIIGAYTGIMVPIWFFKDLVEMEKWKKAKRIQGYR